MIELPAASQRAFASMPPPPEEFGAHVEAALDSLGLHRAVVVGHSLGSAYATYVTHRDTRVNRQPDGKGLGRISGTVSLTIATHALRPATP